MLSFIVQSAIMLNFIVQSTIMLNDIMLSAVMLCHYTECRGAVYSLLVANSWRHFYW